MPSFLVLLFALPLISAYTHIGRNWDFLLSHDVMQQIDRLENNDTLSVVGIERGIDRILRRQPRHVLTQMDIPCAYSRLPMPAQWEIRNVFFNKDYTHEDKVRIITDILGKLPPDQKYVPPAHVCRDEKRTRSKYFDSYNVFKYEISFSFKLSELRAQLPLEDFEAIDDALRNGTLSSDNKLQVLSTRIQKQRPETLDKLFFSRIPIYDPMIKERFQKAWLGFLFGNDKLLPFGDDEKVIERLSSTAKFSNTSAVTAKPIEKTKSRKNKKTTDKMVVWVNAQSKDEQVHKNILNNKPENPKEKALDFNRIVKNAMLVKYPFSMARIGSDPVVRESRLFSK